MTEGVKKYSFMQQQATYSLRVYRHQDTIYTLVTAERHIKWCRLLTTAVGLSFVFELRVVICWRSSSEELYSNHQGELQTVKWPFDSSALKSFWRPVEVTCPEVIDVARSDYVENAITAARSIDFHLHSNDVIYVCLNCLKLSSSWSLTRTSR